MSKTKILFVCLGNICRSPLAEGVFRNKVATANLTEQFIIDSCGTAAWHEGKKPDPGSIKVAQKHGLDISGQRARRLTLNDLNTFDCIVAMDQNNKTNILHLGAGLPGIEEKVFLLREFEIFKTNNLSVPDPYGLPGDAFQEVYDIVERCCEVLLEDLQKS